MVREGGVKSCILLVSSRTKLLLLVDYYYYLIESFVYLITSYCMQLYRMREVLLIVVPILYYSQLVTYAKGKTLFFLIEGMYTFILLVYCTYTIIYFTAIYALPDQSSSPCL